MRSFLSSALMVRLYLVKVLRCFEMSVFGKDEVAISKFAASMPLPVFELTSFSQPVSLSRAKIAIVTTAALLTLKNSLDMREIWQLVTIASTLIAADLPRTSMWSTPSIVSKRCEAPKSLGTLQKTTTLLRVISPTPYQKSGWILDLCVPRLCWAKAWMWCCLPAPDPYARVL